MIIYFISGLIVIVLIAIVIIAVISFNSLKPLPKNENIPSSKEETYIIPVMVIQKGGKLKYFNDASRKLFGISDNSEIFLDKLAKKTNDARYFFSILTEPGSHQLEISNQQYDVFSFDTSDGMVVTFHSTENVDKNYLNNQEDRSSLNRMIQDDFKYLDNFQTVEGDRKSSELSELAKISYSLNSIHEPKELFSRILNSVETLFPIDIFGFILFDENNQVLEAKKPFKGLPDPIVEIIKIKILADTKAERILFSQDILIAEKALENHLWEDLGLSHLANAATIRDAVLIPLTPGDEPMGYILAANHNNGSSSFSQDEIHLLMIIANQTAPIIENLYLLIQAKQRTQRAEALRRISSLASSNATLEEILSFSINELSLLIRADAGGLFLVDQSSMKLVSRSDVKFGEWVFEENEWDLPMYSTEFLDTVTNNRESLLIGKFDETKPVPAIYQDMLDHLGLQSAIVVPMIVKDQGIGEMWFGSEAVSYFNQGDIQIVLSAAQQLAFIIDQTNLSSKAMEAYQEKIDQEKLITQLQRINDFSKKITSLDSKEIFQNLLDVSMEFIPDVESGWIGLWDEKNHWIEPICVRNYDDELLAIRFSEPSKPFETCQSKELLVINNMDFPSSYELSDQEAANYLKVTNFQIPTGCLQAPITSSDDCVAIMLLEIFNRDNQFNSEDESIIHSLLQQVNLALANAELFKKANLQTERLRILSDLSKLISSSLNWDHLRNSLLLQLEDLIEFDTATFWVKKNENLEIIATNGFRDSENRIGITVQIEDSALFSEMVESKKPLAISDVQEDPRFPSLVENMNLSWLGLPLISKSNLIGVIALEKKEKNYYKPDLVQLADAFALQAAIALDNASLYEESINRTINLDERTKKLTMLNKFSSEVNQSLDVDAISKLTIEYLTNLLQCDLVSIFLLLGDGEEIEIHHNLSENDNNQKYPLRDQLLFQKLIQTRGVYNIEDLTKESVIEFLYQDFFALRKTLSIMFIPLISQNDIFGWIGLESRDYRRFFHNEIELALTIANHTSLAIKNADLYHEANHLKEDLEARVEERSRDLLIEYRNNEMLLTISTELASSLDLDPILDQTLTIINESMNVSGSLVYILEMKKIFQVNLNESTTNTKISIELIGDYFNHAINTKTSSVENNLNLNVGVVVYTSWMFLPLIFGESVLGVLVVFHNIPGYFSKRDLELGEAIAGQISIALNNAEIFKLVQDQSEYLGSMLREQEIESSRSKAILEAVADGVLVTGIQSEIVLINQSAMSILHTGKENSENTLQGLETFFGERIRAWISTIDHWTNNPVLLSDSVYSETIELSENQYISVHLSPVIWRNEFLGTVSVFRDVSVQVQIDQLKTDFISNISHELRTPLTSIKGYVEVLLMGAAGKVSERQEKFLQTIQTNTSRLSNLVDDILDVSKIGSNTVILNVKSFDLIDLFSNVIENHKNSLISEQKQIQYQINQIKPIPTITADPERIEQILVNILNNARDYSKDGDLIEITINSDKDTIKVDVQDQGMGIPLVEQKHVFDRFFRGKNALQVNSSGTGLGLSIAKTLVEMHNGNINLSSSGVPGEGVCVSFTIPIKSLEVDSQ